MAIKSRHYLFIYFLSKLYLTNSSISAILFTATSEASQLHEQALNIADKALCVSDIFCGIHEILLLFNKMKQNNR